MVRSAHVMLVVVALVSPWAAGQSCTVQVFLASPSTSGGVLPALLQSIDGAHTTLEIAIDSLTDDQLGDAIVRAHRRGVAVRVILGAGAERVIDSEYQKLSSSGMPVFLIDIGGSFDHRFVIVDQRIVLTGSYGWAASTTPLASGSLVQITCATSSQATTAQAYHAEFERLWARWNQVAPPSALPTSVVSSVSILLVDRSSQCIYLLNTSESEVDLSDWSLYDLEGGYTFPTGTVIPPNDPYHLCSEVFNPTHDHTELYLDPEGDEVFLVTPEGDIIDEVVW